MKLCFPVISKNFIAKTKNSFMNYGLAKNGCSLIENAVQKDIKF